jgi:hypothetical protein
MLHVAYPFVFNAINALWSEARPGKARRVEIGS